MAVGNRPVTLFRLLPAVALSAVINLSLIGMLALAASPGKADDKLEQVDDTATKPPEFNQDKDTEPPAIKASEDVDEDGKDADDINFNIKRLDDKSVPGDLQPDDPVGIVGAQGDKETNIAAPSGLGKGQGGPLVGPEDGSAPNIGAPGGYGGGSSRPLEGTFYGRSGATREIALKEGGGSPASEAAVIRGLNWLKRHQNGDGSWSLDDFRCNCGGKGNHNNDIAGTAFGLLPFLGAGHTHKINKDNPYSRNVLRGLSYLMRRQNKRTGDFGGGMYAHGLAAIAICEAYGLTQDPLLKRSAQQAVNFIVYAQHSEGGWRYEPRTPGDTSVVGWQVMALKSAQMANLNVPPRTMKKAEQFLDSVMDGTYGYGYTTPGSAPTTSAVGLLCRMYLQGWGPATPKLAKGVDNWIKTNMPGSLANMYYYYYATQVMHHFGGKAWTTWNEKMRDRLIATQDKGQTRGHEHRKGSWSPEGDAYGSVGGRLMVTSLSLLTLEVYYRHLPLYRRDMVDKKNLGK
jgi:hypothetical protein